MRTLINIKTNCLPIIYRHKIISLIKEALRISDNAYKEYLYGSKIPKPFCFNLYIPPTRKVHSAEIKIDNRYIIRDKVFFFPENSYCQLFISSLDYRFILDLYNGLNKIKVFEFSSDDNMLINGCRIKWQIKKLYVLNEKTINKYKILFKTCSPLVVENKEDKPVLFYEDTFIEELNIIMSKKFKSLIGRDLISELKFKPLNMKKQVVKHTLKEFRERTGKPVMYITANAGTFELRGHPEDLTLIYQIGLGNRTGQGFGMVEVVG